NQYRSAIGLPANMGAKSNGNTMQEPRAEIKIPAATVPESPALPFAQSPTPAAKPDADVVSTTKVGDKSELTPHGFYWEFNKDEKPYAVRDMNNPHVGIMSK